MESNITIHDPEYWRNAMVVLANYHQARSGSMFFYSQVQSRFLLWCISGRGEMEVNRERFPLTPGCGFLTTWNHTTSYLPNPEEPFQVGCIHIIPDMPEEHPVVYGPFHSVMPEFDEYNHRRDETPPGFERTVLFRLPFDHPLWRLGAYVIDRFQANCPEFMLRMFPRQLLYELRNAQLEQQAARGSVYPETIQRMLNVIDRYIEDELHLRMLVHAAGISPAGVYRTFRKFFACTPGAYIMNRRLDRAAQLLRRSSIGIGEISRRMRFSDPFYFSKCFKRRFGMPPRAYRSSDAPPPPEPWRRESVNRNDIPTIKHWIFSPEPRS